MNDTTKLPRQPSLTGFMRAIAMGVSGTIAILIVATYVLGMILLFTQEEKFVQQWENSGFFTTSPVLVAVMSAVIHAMLAAPFAGIYVLLADSRVRTYR